VEKWPIRRRETGRIVAQESVGGVKKLYSKENLILYPAKMQSFWKYLQPPMDIFPSNYSFEIAPTAVFGRKLTLPIRVG
jgi:hypothetical protein